MKPSTRGDPGHMFPTQATAANNMRLCDELEIEEKKRKKKSE